MNLLVWPKFRAKNPLEILRVGKNMEHLELLRSDDGNVY